MEPSEMENEPGFGQDWNFIVLSHGSIIYDISTGILYEFHATMGRGDSDAVFARKAGDLSPNALLVNGPTARVFWEQLRARVTL